MDQRIMIVDDEEKICMAFEKSFKRSGYIVISAQSAEAALEILENETFQVVFLDLNLPKMNGIELGRIIRKRSPMTVINAITGYSSLFELADCREAGFDDYFTKPYEMNRLKKITKETFAKIDRWMGKAPSEDENGS